MKNQIKIKEEELVEIRMLHTKFQECIQKLGTLQIEKMELDNLVTSFVEKEKKLKEEWSSLQQLEKSLLDKIVKTYGEGNLNMEDGTFVQTSPPNQKG